MAQKKKTAVKRKTAKVAAKKSVKRQPAKAASAAKSAVKRGAVKAAASKTKAAKKTVAKKPGAKTAAGKKTAAAKRPVAAKKPAVNAKRKAGKSAVKPAAKKAVKAAAKPVAKKALKPAAKKAVKAKTTKAATKPVMTAKQVASKAAAARVAPPVKKAAPAKPVNQRHGFKLNEYVVYPAHGVGQVTGIEEQEIAGISLELFVITFEKDKMTLRVPTGKCESVGMRKLAEEHIVKRAMLTLKGKARIKRTMWSRRAQEYESKINSGDLISIAEVVRDLYRSETQQEQSYSERQLYEAALDRMAREIAVIEKLDERGANQRITEILSKSARGRRQAIEEADAASDAEDDGADVKAA